jgi:hypothetical protein
MKTFEPLAFDPARCLREVLALRKWLALHPQLEERRHLLPFFRRRRQLSAFVASYSPDVINFDRIAFEYPVFGDFTCDLAVGDSAKNAYCFIEFEDAAADSLLVRRGKKATREWSPRFHRGFGQIVDWFYKLDDMKKSDAFAARFGARSIAFTGILVVGRDHHLQPGERERLEWWKNNVVVASQKIQGVTFDGLVEDMLAWLERSPLTAKTRRKR